MTPYATGAATKKKRGRGAATTEEDYGMEEEEGAAVASESEGEEEGVDTDTMIKVRMARWSVLYVNQVCTWVTLFRLGDRILFFEKDPRWKICFLKIGTSTFF